MLDSVVKAKKSIIFKHFWKNVNMKQKKINMEDLIDGDFKKNLSDESDNEADNNSNE